MNGVQYDTYKETCRALGFLEDDHMCNLVMQDAKNEKLPKQMRDLFIILLAEVNISDPEALFEKYHESMSEDFSHKLLPPDNMEQELLKWMLLIDIQEQLQLIGRDVLFTEIGTVTEEMKQRVAVARRKHTCFMNAK